jgi:hypothetical protein
MLRFLLFFIRSLPLRSIASTTALFLPDTIITRMIRIPIQTLIRHPSPKHLKLPNPHQSYIPATPPNKFSKTHKKLFVFTKRLSTFALPTGKRSSLKNRLGYKLAKRLRRLEAKNLFKIKIKKRLVFRNKAFTFALHFERRGNGL